MNLSLKTLTIALAASAAIAFGQDAPLENPNNPAAAVEKAKEVVAAVQEVNAAGAAAAAPEVAAADAAEVAAAPEVEAQAEVAAAPEADNAGGPGAVPAAEVGGADVPTTGDDELEDPDKITVSLDAVELEDVVRLFTRLSGANIICNTTNLHGTVTANLADIGWKPAFKAILRQQGLALIEDPLNPDVYEIGVPPPPGKEPLVSKTFKLNYLKASEAATILRNFLGLDAGGKASGAKKTVQKDKDGKVIEEVEAIANEQKGYVVAHPAANTVIVSCRGEDKMREVEKVITDLDVARQQVYIEAKIVQVSGIAAKRIGIDWSFLDGYTISAGPFMRDYTKVKTRDKTDSTFRQSNAGTHNRWYASDIDQAPSASVPNAMPIYGADGWDHGSEFDSPVNYIYRNRTESSEPDKIGAWSSVSRTKGSMGDSLVTDVRTAIFNANAVRLVMSALETSDDVAQISNPKLIVANEESAIIDMTRKVPYVELSKENNNDNNNTSYSAEMKLIPSDSKVKVPYIEGAFFTYGISVDVTPRINNSSNITVVIEPMISVKNDGETRKVKLDPDNEEYYAEYPAIDVKRVRTVFSLGNGQTAVIGGLTQTYDREDVKKVPILGSIPILKYLFSHTEKRKEQVETIIFVTVGIVNPENNESRMGLPDGARLVQKRIDADGKIIDKRFKDMETKEQKLEADLKEAEAKGLIVPEVVEE